MVQTRSKYRLLQQNATATSMEESTQPSSTTSKEKKHKKEKSTCQLSQPSLCSPVDLSAAYLSEKADGTSDTCDDEQELLKISSFVPHQQSFNLNESEDETFDNNLHLEQQRFIDIYNREDDEEQNLELNDFNVGASAEGINLSQSPNLWPIKIDDLKWSKTNKNKDSLIMGNFSYIYMSESEKKNKLNFRCQRRDVKCGAVVHLNLNTRSFIDTNDTNDTNHINHNHPPDKIAMKQKILNHTIEERINAEPTAVLKTIERVYAEANLTDEEQLNMRLPKAVANTFYKKRARRYPAHPKTQNFDIPDLYSKNNRGEDFIIYDTNKEQLDGRLLIFST